ncbi:PAS domain S-box protein [Planktosalinus lacus]|uniref:histidine kinase n=1 Tax=Planktosalinus lacus TaxID=1526573 RepID=A0A8J2V9K3_9FLAO|nr:PAS domain S-box protein [Planktosalinus lacus]GGD92663.1 hypothetical protein GCM10011312_15600 [Planktosalinus lacus]
MSTTHDYSTLFYYSPLPKWVYDVKTYQILDVNQAAIDLYGYSKDEFLALTIKDLRPKEYIPKVLAAHEKIDITEGNINFGVFTHQKKNGALIRMEINGHKVDFQGRKCITVVCQDVTVKEKQFRQSQQAVHIMNASLDVICSIDAQGKFISVSQAAIDVWGYQPEELEGKAYLELVYEEDLELTRQTAQDIISGKSVTTFQNRYLKKNGEIAYNIWSARWDESTQTMYAIARDGSEKRKADEVLAEREQRFKVLVQEGSDLIAILDEEGIYTYVSPTSVAILGFAPEAFIGKSPFEFIHPKDADKVQHSLEKAATSKRVTVEPFRFKNSEGEWRWIETVLTNMLDHPSIQGFVANSRDVTEKRNEEQHSKLLQSVITHTNDAVLITEAEPQDAPGPRIVYVNDAFTRMTGYTAAEVIGQSPRILQGPKSDRAELARLGKALRNWEPCEITTLNYKKNGEEFWINFTVSPVADEKGWYTHWIAIERDVTAAKNEALQKALFSQISAVFNLTTDLYQSLQELSQIIVSVGDFSFSEIWLPSNHKNKLRLFASFASTTEGKSFYKFSKKATETEIGEGLQGLTWSKNKPLLWGTDAIKKNFIRCDAAKKASIKSAMGIPLEHQGELVGVLLVGSTLSENFVTSHKPVLTQLGTLIGTEIKRKRLESDLHHLFEALPDLICLADFKGEFLKINKAGCALLGYEEKEIIGAHIHDFIHPADVDISAKAMQSLQAGATNFKFENRYITQSGKTIWLSWNCNTIEEEGVIYATAKEITDEKKLREVVSNASELATIGGWEIDLINNQFTWSDVVYHIYETDPTTFIPELASSIDFYREDYKEQVTNIIQEAIESGDSFDFEAALISAKGNEKWVRAIGKPEIVNGNCIRLYGSFQDITSIKETEHRLQAITNDLPGVTFQYYIYPDKTDALVSVSEASHKIWGLSPEACEKKNSLVWNQLKKGGNIEQVLKDIQHAAATLTQWNSKWKNVLPNGDVRWHEGVGTPYRLPDGTVLFNSMIFDITDMVNTTQLYEEASELAKIGSWELDLGSQEGPDVLFWSPMVKKILEVDENYNPSLTGGFEFYKDESRDRIEKALQRLIEEGTEFDEELLIVTQKGKEKWIRCIGKRQQVQGITTKVFGSFQDINSMKTAELKLKEILGSISDAFYAVDHRWNFTYFNKEAENLLNRKSSEVLGKSIWKEFAPAKGTELERVYRKVAKTGKPMSLEYLYPGDGSWYELNVYPSSGGISSYFKNIDERKKIAQELQKAFEEKNNILESIGDAFFAVDKDWTVTYWNKEAEQLLGRKREEVLGKNLWEVYPDAVALDFYKYYHDAMASGTTVSFEEFYPALNKWFEVSAYPSEEGLSVYFKDVTLRKETHIQIQQANERFEKVTQATTDAIWDWDIENDVFYRGNGFEKLFGYDVNKKFKKQDFWHDRFHPDDLTKIKTSLKETIKDPKKGFWRQEYRLLHQEGELKTVIDKGVIIRNNKGKAVRMVGAITDITDHIKYEKELQKLNELLKQNIYELEVTNEQLEQFAFIASHDLQEPLRMISSFLNQLERKYSNQLDEKAHQYIHYATDGAKRMKQIILDLLDYSRAGRDQQSLEEIDLNQLIDDYKVLRGKIISEKEVSIHTKGFPKIAGFKAPVTQTLHSLLDNAIKYSKEGIPPKVSISLSDKKTHWQLKVEDNGIGIDKRFYDKIFVIFQRLHNKDEYEGTGIGLAVSKKQVESWGGKIWVKSEPGIGSAFYFTIKKPNI